LASVNLFHALHQLGDVDGAFREVARFRSIKLSPEYERMLPEVEEGTLQILGGRPFDSFQKHVLEIVQAELRARPLKQ